MCENVFVDIEKLLVGDYTPVDNVKEEKEPGRKVIPAVDIDILVILLYGMVLRATWANNGQTTVRIGASDTILRRTSLT